MIAPPKYLALLLVAAGCGPQVTIEKQNKRGQFSESIRQSEDESLDAKAVRGDDSDSQSTQPEPELPIEFDAAEGSVVDMDADPVMEEDPVPPEESSELGMEVPPEDEVPNPTANEPVWNGAALYDAHCLACHGSLAATNKPNRTAEQIKLAISQIPPMQNLSFLEDEAIQAISNALSALGEQPDEMNPDDPEDPEEEPNPEPNYLALGQELYRNNCQSCHLNIENSTKKDSSSNEIAAAIAAVPVMQGLSSLNQEQLEWIALALKSPEMPDPDPGAGLALVYQAPLPTTRLFASKLQILFNQNSPQNSNNTHRTQINTIIDRQVSRQHAFFGGRCNHLDYTNDLRVCPGGSSHMKSSFNGSANVVRSGHQFKFCSEILHRDRGFYSLMAGADMVAGNARNLANIGKLASTMLSGKQLPNSSLIQLQSIATAASGHNLGSINEWRYIAIAICQSTLFESY